MEKTTKKDKPINYWISEVFLPKLQSILEFPINSLYSMKYYSVNRWVRQTHALVAHSNHIKPGTYSDFDTKMLYCLFDELVDFVEIEVAYNVYRWDAEKQKDLSWWKVGRWRTGTWRSHEAAMEHLEWEMSLVKEGTEEPNGQAISAKELLTLYLWWTVTHKNRVDAYEASGWSDYCDSKRERGIKFLEKDTEENEKLVKNILAKSNKIEQQYEEEDTEMLIRLVKLRKYMWT